MRAFIIVVLLGISFGLFAEDFDTEVEQSDNMSVVEEPDAKVLIDIIEGQLGAIKTHDVARAYTLYGSEDFQKIIHFEEFKRLVIKYNVLSNNKSFTFKRKHTSANIVTIYGQLTANDGQSLEVEYSFVHENGEWKILGIELYTQIKKQR